MIVAVLPALLTEACASCIEISQPACLCQSVRFPTCLSISMHMTDLLLQHIHSVDYSVVLVSLLLPIICFCPYTITTPSGNELFWYLIYAFSGVGSFARLAIVLPSRTSLECSLLMKHATDS